MYLKSLRVKRWRSFGEFSIDFAEGLNVVAGPNESGKSSLREALVAAFLSPLRPRGRSVVSAAKPWGTNSTPEVEVAFVHKGKLWRVHKRFFTDVAELECEGRILFQGPSVQNELEELLAGNAFSSIVAAQGEIAMAGVPPRLRSQVAASEVLSPGISWLESRLDDLNRQYWSEHRGSPRKPLEDVRVRAIECEDEVRRLEQEISESDRESRELEELDLELLVERTRLEEVREQEAAEMAQIGSQIRDLEREVNQRDSWIKRWEELRVHVLEHWKRVRDHQDKVQRVGELGGPPDRQGVDSLMAVQRYLEARRTWLLQRELDSLHPPAQADLVELKRIGEDLRALEGLIEVLPDDVDQSAAHALEAEVEQAKERCTLAEASLQELEKALEQYREIVNRRRLVAGEVRSLDDGIARWKGALAAVLEQGQDLRRYRTRLADLKNVFGSAPDRDKLESLKSRQQYCRYRLQRVIKQEIEELSLPSSSDLLALEKIEAKVEALESTLRVAQPDVGSRLLGPLLGAASVVIGLLLGTVLGLGIGWTMGVALVFGASAFLIGQMLRRKPSRAELLRAQELERLSNQRDERLKSLAVVSLGEAQQRVKRAADLETELAAHVPSGDLTDSRPSLEDVEEIDSWDKRRLLLELESLPARLTDLERQWVKQNERQQQHREAYEAALQANPQFALDASLKQLATVAREFLGVSLEAPKDPTEKWFVELEQSDWLAPIKARHTECLRQLHTCDEDLAKSSETEFAAQRNDLRQNLKQQEESMTAAIRRLESVRGSWVGNRELLRKNVRSSTFLTKHLTDFIEWPGEEYLGPLREAAHELRKEIEGLRQGILQRWEARDEPDLWRRSQRANELRGQVPAERVTDDLLSHLRTATGDKDLDDLGYPQLMLRLKQLPEAIAKAERDWVHQKEEYERKAQVRTELMSHNPLELLQHGLTQLARLASEQSDLKDVSLPGDPAEWVEVLGEDSLQKPVSRRRKCLADEVDALRRISAGQSDSDHILINVRNSRTAIADRVNEIMRRIQQFQGRIEGHGGLFGQLAEAREQLDRAQTEQRRVELEAGALQLLKKSLGDAKAEIESDLVGPLRDRINERLLRLTAGRYLGLEMETDFTTERVFFEDQKPVSVSDLSYGTQEQLAFLSRLCLAELLAEEERSLAVFDDNLVHTDSIRMSLACGVIDEASERVQVLIFTCHPERFLSLKGKVNTISMAS